MTLGDVFAISSVAPLLNVEIPGLPPSLWASYHQGKHLTQPAREWRDTAIWCLRGTGFRSDKIPARYFVLLELVSPTRGRWDVDNREKLIFDAMTLAGIWPDDSQMDGHISVYRKGKEQLTCVSLWRFGAGGVRE